MLYGSGACSGRGRSAGACCWAGTTASGAPPARGAGTVAGGSVAGGTAASSACPGTVGAATSTGSAAGTTLVSPTGRGGVAASAPGDVEASGAVAEPPGSAAVPWESPVASGTVPSGVPVGFALSMVSPQPDDGPGVRRTHNALLRRIECRARPRPRGVRARALREFNQVLEGAVAGSAPGVPAKSGAGSGPGGSPAPGPRGRPLRDRHHRRRGAAEPARLSAPRRDGKEARCAPSTGPRPPVRARRRARRHRGDRPTGRRRSRSGRRPGVRRAAGGPIAGATARVCRVP